MTLPTPRRLLLVALLVAGAVALDQATKAWAVETLPEHQRFSYLGDVFRLERVRNAGAFLSLGASLPEGVRSVIFTWGVAAICAGALWIALRRTTGTRAASAAALVAAGGETGGWVVDFMNLGIGPLRTGVFNVADLALVAGAVLLVLPARRSGASG
jgi:signal peptidase II